MSGIAVARGNRRRRSVVVRAVLAGGIVLGVGAAVTLAAWQDDEFANGTFTASDFNLVGTTTGAESFGDNAASPGAPLAFSVDATSLSPGAVSYAPYGVALDEGTTVGATVTVSAGTNTGDLTNLSYAVYETSSFTCDSDATSGTALIPAGTALGTVPSSTSFALTAATAAAHGTPQYLCFVVTASDDLARQQTGEAVWDFHAVNS